MEVLISGRKVTRVLQTEERTMVRGEDWVADVVPIPKTESGGAEGWYTRCYDAQSNPSWRVVTCSHRELAAQYATKFVLQCNED